MVPLAPLLAARTAMRSSRDVGTAVFHHPAGPMLTMLDRTVVARAWLWIDGRRI